MLNSTRLKRQADLKIYTKSQKCYCKFSRIVNKTKKIKVSNIINGELTGGLFKVSGGLKQSKQNHITFFQELYVVVLF